MTVVENLTPRVQYNYISEQQEYPITFPYIERQYVKCMIGDTLLTYNIDYQVPAFDQESLDDNELYLTLLITPTVGDVITIYRETPLDQQAEFPQTAKFSSQKITEALDKLTQQQQEQQDDLNTCLRLSKNIPVDFNTELPEPAANQVIQWNEDGTQLINYDLRSEIQTIDTKANTAISTANTAESKADTAISTANTAITKANNAISTANTASTNASNAVTTANNAASTADTASTNASNAVNTANNASSTATSAKNKVDALETDIQAVIDAAEKINELEQAVTTATNAATTASDKADIASNKATEAVNAADRAEAVIPTQTGQNGKYLKTNGTSTIWENVPDSLPSQTGNNGKFLKTNGTSASWETVDLSAKQDTLVSGTNIKTINNNSILGSGNLDIDALPSQTGNADKFLKTNGTNASWAEVESFSRNIFEDVISDFPLTDAGVHLKDGSVLQYGSYQAFIDVVALKYVSNPEKFTTEALWQDEVTATGYCDKYVYDSVNQTVRLPKIGSQLIHNLPSTLGVKGNGNTLGFTDGTNTNVAMLQSTYGYFRKNLAGTAVGTANNAQTVSPVDITLGVSTDTTKSGIIAETTGIGKADVYYYVVIATTTKTQIQVNIDEIATDLNGKADVDLTNVNNSGTSRSASWAMPSNTYITYTVGATGTSYTAPANGWVRFYGKANNSTNYLSLGSTSIGTAMGNYPNNNGASVFIPISKGTIFYAWYLGFTDLSLYFYYAEGSESEAE